ncbi:MAG: LTA synthase family protein [Clostridiales Family XIII bacterium]|nr:LTA synthase family protein [Clostridiales Family XIII bacterium]
MQILKLGIVAEEFKGKSIKDFLADGWPGHKRSLILRVAFLITIAVFAVMYWMNPDYYTNYYTDGTPWFAIRKAAGTMLILAVLALIAVTPNFFNEKWNKIFTVFCCLAVPLGIFFSLEYLFHTHFFYLPLFRVLLNLVIIYLLCLIGVFFTGAVRTGLFVGAGLICAFGYISYFAYNFRGSPLIFSDLSNFGTGAKMLGDFTYELNFRGYIFMVAMFAIFILTSKISVKKRFGWKPRVALALVFCIGWFSLIDALVFSDHFFWRHGVNGIKVSTFDPMKKGYNKNGGLLSLIRSAKISMVEKPDGYSVKAVNKLVSKIEKKAAASDTPAAETKKPNVIAIMNESFTDVANIGAHIDTNEPLMPFYDSLTDNTIKGWAYSSGFGGGTANSEFEFFTGDSLAFVPVNASPYQLYMKSPQPSLVSTLKDQGYQGNVAVHPFNRDGYSRPRAYEMLGFDKYLDETNFKNPKELRDYISDEADYDKLIALYEKYDKKSDDPIFLWTITMQNHGTYRNNYKNFTPDIAPLESAGLTPSEIGQYNEVGKVMSLIHESDRATGEIVEYFKNVDEPTIIVFFGDHQASLPSPFYEKVLGAPMGKLTPEDLMKRYRVPFFIWANFDIEEQTYEHISMNYLSSLMLRAGGIEMTKYNKYLLDLFEEIPCMTAFGHYDKDGKFYNTEDKIQRDPHANPKTISVKAKTPQDQTLHDYYMLEYNNLFDAKNRVSGFFYLEN